MNSLGFDTTPPYIPQTPENVPDTQTDTLFPESEDTLFPELKEEDDDNNTLSPQVKVTNGQRVVKLENSNRQLLQRITQIGARTSDDLEMSANMQSQMGELKVSLTHLQNREIALKGSIKEQGQTLGKLKEDYTTFTEKCNKVSNDAGELRGNLDLLKREEKICIDGLVALIEEKKKFEERVTKELKTNTDFVIGSAEWCRKYRENSQIVADWNQYVSNMRLLFGILSVGTIGVGVGLITGLNAGKNFGEAAGADMKKLSKILESMVGGSFLAIFVGVCFGAIASFGDDPLPQDVIAARQWLVKSKVPAAPALPTPEVRKSDPRIEKMVTLLQAKLRERKNASETTV